uniref:G-protein coupled receptors family 1 profile domain-containing protein n=1 Tax=Felis catus TaxID=9685 RepID=A0ABI7VX27_FELCA
MDSRLHTPMYDFLVNLSLLDTAYISSTGPQVLEHLLAAVRTVPYRACLPQIFFLHFLAPWECFLLTAMACDRYAAIGRPPHHLVLLGRRTDPGRNGFHLPPACLGRCVRPHRPCSSTEVLRASPHHPLLLWPPSTDQTLLLKHVGQRACHVRLQFRGGSCTPCPGCDLLCTCCGCDSQDSLR